MPLRKLFLCSEDISHPYGTYFVSGTDENAEHIFIYLILLINHTEGAILIPIF